MSDDEEYEGIDGTKVKNVVIVIMVVGVLIFGAFVLNDHFKTGPYKAICEKNPRLRYAQACNDLQDCVDKCARKQYDEAHK